MKAIILMFDSLNRKWMPSYGGDPDRFPNFARLARKTATFDHSYVCSMPCMPARRDLHTGRPSFLHTGWVPLQPYDESLPELLREKGVSSHLITDHYHYLEDGGATYHNRYDTWQMFRGQEGDPWIGQVREPEIPPNINGKGRKQDWVNRQFLRDESDWSQVQTFDAGLEFLERNHSEDNWFLQIETFDPHEPFTAPPRLQKLFPHAGEEPIFDWPAYDAVSESEEEIARARDNYGALTALCDEQLGRVLDYMDQKNMWQDTLLIVWTDHGYLLGEHNLWAKNHPTIWDEIGHTPFFVWDPRHPETADTRRLALVQPAIDLAPTLLRFFGAEPTGNMTGRDLAPVLESDRPVRDTAIYGYFQQAVHVTDGRYCYLRHVQRPEQITHVYTSIPTHMHGFFSKEEMQNGEFLPSLPFSNGYPVIRYPAKIKKSSTPLPHVLFNLETDPDQENPSSEPQVEERLAKSALQLMREAHAPKEMLLRYGF